MTSVKKSLFVTVAVMLWVGVCFATSGKGDHLKRGSAYYNGRSLEKAISEFRLALKDDPKSYKAYYMMGNSYYLLGEKEQALAAYTKVTRIKPDEAEVVAFVRRLTEEVGIIDIEHTLEAAIEVPQAPPDDVVSEHSGGDPSLPQLPPEPVAEEAAPAAPELPPELPRQEPRPGLPELPADDADDALPEIELPAESSGSDLEFPVLPPEQEEAPAESPAHAPEIGIEPPAVAPVESVAAPPPLPESGGEGMAERAGEAAEPSLSDLEQLLAEEEPVQSGAEGGTLGWTEREVIKKKDTKGNGLLDLGGDAGLPEVPSDLLSEDIELEAGDEIPATPMDAAVDAAPELPPDVPASSGDASPPPAEEEELDLESLLESLD